MKEKLLVTGGAGYIGAHTVAELHHQGYEVVIVDNLSRSDDTLLKGLENLLGQKPDFRRGDCADRVFLDDVFRSAGPFRGVLHFAAYKSVGESVLNPLIYYHNNLASIVSLLEVMRAHHVTDLIFSSSCTVYGQPDKIPVNENAPFKRAESPYGATKQMAERILEDCAPVGFRTISLRYFNPIGAHPSAELGELPMGSPNNLVPYITQTAAGVRKNLTIFGNDYDTPDGTCIRDFIHVTDLAVAHVKAMQYLSAKENKPLLEAFNLGTGKGISVLELVNEFMRVTGVKVPYSVGPRRAGDVEKVYADPTRANHAFNWKTRFSIQECLLHAWQWEQKIRNNL